MKKILAILLGIIIIGTPVMVFAHPGNTAADGCHYCRTNCDYWGVPWNERHCHSDFVAPEQPSTPLPQTPLPPNTYNPNSSTNTDTNVSLTPTSQTEMGKKPSAASTKPFIGTPKTKEQLLRCPVVANKKSKIYHLKGSKYIKTMTVKDKRCYATAKDAKKAGYRKSK